MSGITAIPRAIQKTLLGVSCSSDIVSNGQPVQATPGCLEYARVSAVRLGNPRLSYPSPKRITPNQARTRLTWPRFTDLNAAALAGYQRFFVPETEPNRRVAIEAGLRLRDLIALKPRLKRWCKTTGRRLSQPL